MSFYQEKTKTVENLDSSTWDKLVEDVANKVMEKIEIVNENQDEQSEEASNSDNKRKYPLNFLNKKLKLTYKDRHDPNLLLVIFLIEVLEREFGKGHDYLSRLRDNYKFEFDDETLYSRLEQVLTNQSKK
jgi:hypothetical protein